MKFAAKCVAITKCPVISLGVSIGGDANILEFCSGDGRFIGRKGPSSATGFTTTEEKDCEESRENGQGEAAKFSVGQGRSPANLLTLIHSLATFFFQDILSTDLPP